MTVCSFRALFFAFCCHLLQQQVVTIRILKVQSVISNIKLLDGLQEILEHEPRCCCSVHLFHPRGRVERLVPLEAFTCAGLGGDVFVRRLPTAGSDAKPFQRPSAVMKASACPPLSKGWWVARGCCAALSDSSRHLSGCSAVPHHCGFSTACSAVLETECKSAGKLLGCYLFVHTL